jgi:hypothetical protein
MIARLRRDVIECFIGPFPYFETQPADNRPVSMNVPIRDRHDEVVTRIDDNATITRA